MPHIKNLKELSKNKGSKKLFLKNKRGIREDSVLPFNI